MITKVELFIGVKFRLKVFDKLKKAGDIIRYLKKNVANKLLKHGSTSRSIQNRDVSQGKSWKESLQIPKPRHKHEGLIKL